MESQCLGITWLLAIFLLFTVVNFAKAGAWCTLHDNVTISYCADVCCPFNQLGCCLCSSLEAAGLPCSGGNGASSPSPSFSSSSTSPPSSFLPSNPFPFSSNSKSDSSNPTKHDLTLSGWAIAFLVLLAAVIVAIIGSLLTLLVKKNNRIRNSARITSISPLSARSTRLTNVYGNNWP